MALLSLSQCVTDVMSPPPISTPANLLIVAFQMVGQQEMAGDSTVSVSGQDLVQKSRISNHV